MSELLQMKPWMKNDLTKRDIRGTGNDKATNYCGCGPTS